MLALRRSGFQYYPYYRVERIISLGRIALAGFFLLALIVDPTEPARFAETTISILAVYFAYAAGLAIALQRGTALNPHLTIFLHSIDLVLFTAVMLFSDGPTSPFFVYYVYLLICATMRWQWRGTLWTAAISLGAMVTMVIYHRGPMHGDNHELNVIIIRISYLLVLAGILGYMGAHEQKLRSTLAQLAFWSRPVPMDLQELLAESLSRAAVLLKAPRMLLVWEEDDEPWFLCALWVHGELQIMREHVDEFEVFAGTQLIEADFYAPDLEAPWPNITLIEERKLRSWEGADPFSSRFIERFAIRSVLCIPAKGKQFSGHVFALDTPDMTSDELVLGEIVAHELVARLDQFFLQQHLRQAVAQEERFKLARDLHDGILQALTGVTLRLGAAERLVEKDPALATHIIREVQGLISAEQHDLRDQIQQLRPVSMHRVEGKAPLHERLAEMVERVRSNWPVEVTLSCNSLTLNYGQSFSREVLMLAHEGIVNAARHAKAATIRVQLTAEQDMLRMVVADDGHGFPYYGRYSLAELNMKSIGPKTLCERTACLGGTLTLDTAVTGTTVEIVLPTLSPGALACQ